MENIFLVIIGLAAVAYLSKLLFRATSAFKDGPSSGKCGKCGSNESPPALK